MPPVPGAGSWGLCRAVPAGLTFPNLLWPFLWVIFGVFLQGEHLSLQPVPAPTLCAHRGAGKAFPCTPEGDRHSWGCGDTADNKKINECPSQAPLSAQSCFSLLYPGIPPANSSLSQHWISSALVSSPVCSSPSPLSPAPDLGPAANFLLV